MHFASGVHDMVPSCLIASAPIRYVGYWSDIELRIGGRDDVQARGVQLGLKSRLQSDTQMRIHAADCELLLDCRSAGG